MRTIPVDLILHETALKLRELPEENHRGLADNIDTYAVDHRAVADQWNSGAGDGAGVCQSARWLITNRLDTQAFAPGHVFAETRAMEVAVARRLADCALSLLVTQDADDRAAASTLLAAAHRVAGLERIEAAVTTVGAWPPVVTIANLKAAEVENTNKASIIAKQEKIIANLKDVTNQRDTAWAERNVARNVLQDLRGALHEVFGLSMDGSTDKTILERIGFLKSESDTWWLWAAKLAGPNPESSQRSANALRETLSARLIDSKGQRLKVARECLPPGVDIIACLRDDKPTTYKASNTGEEYDSPEAAVRAAWEHHLRLTQSVHERAAHSTGTIRSVTVNGVTQEVNVQVKAGDTISFSKDNEVVVKPREFKVGDRVTTPSGPDGTITSIGTRARVEMDETSWVYDLSDLQQVPPAKFKVGDHVVANDPRFTGRYFYVASVYRDTIGVSVKPEDGHGFTFAAADLSLVPAVEP